MQKEIEEIKGAFPGAVVWIEGDKWDRVVVLVKVRTGYTLRITKGGYDTFQLRDDTGSVIMCINLKKLCQILTTLWEPA